MFLVFSRELRKVLYLLTEYVIHSMNKPIDCFIPKVTLAKTVSILTILISTLLFSCCQNSTKKRETQLESKSNEIAKKFEEKTSSTYLNPFETSWLLTSGLFDSILSFKRIQLSDSSKKFGKKFIFNNGDLKFEQFNAVPSCGHGILYLDSCSYAEKNEIFTFYFKGGHFLETTFVYSAKFKLKAKDELEFTFTRIETIIYETGTFQDLFLEK